MWQTSPERLEFERPPLPEREVPVAEMKAVQEINIQFAKRLSPGPSFSHPENLQDVIVFPMTAVAKMIPSAIMFLVNYLWTGHILDAIKTLGKTQETQKCIGPVAVGDTLRRPWARAFCSKMI